MNREIDDKILEAYQKSILNEDENFIDDSVVSKAVMKDLTIAVNQMIMKEIIPSMKKKTEAVIKKHKLDAKANMFVKNYGTADLNDVMRELLGQSLVNAGNLKKRIGF